MFYTALAMGGRITGQLNYLLPKKLQSGPHGCCTFTHPEFTDCAALPQPAKSFVCVKLVWECKVIFISETEGCRGKERTKQLPSKLSFKITPMQ